MCRTGTRHCRDSWSAEQKALENARRRITRNSAKRDAADTVEARAKYEALAAAASEEATALQGTIAQRKAEHLAQSESAQETPVSAPRNSTPTTAAEIASTSASRESATTPSPSTPATLPAQQAPVAPARQRTAPPPRPATGGRSSRRRSSTAPQGGLLDAVWSFITGDRQEALHRSLERAGIEHSFQNGFLHIPKESWTEDTPRALQEAGLKEAPISWTGDWVLPTHNHVGINAPRNVA